MSKYDQLQKLIELRASIHSPSELVASLADMVDVLEYETSVGSQTETTIYVDGDNGSDSTGTGSQSSPFATVDKALEFVPRVLLADHTIICANATARYDVDLTKGWVCAGGSLTFGSSDVTSFVTGTLTATASALVLTDSGASWTADEHAGRFVRITAGPGAGQYRQIIENTATTLTVARRYETDPTSASSYEIFDPVTEVNMRGQALPVFGDDYFFFGAIRHSELQDGSYTGFGVNFTGLRLHADSSFSPWVQDIDFNVCTIADSSSGMKFSGCRFGVGQNNVYGDQDGSHFEAMVAAGAHLVDAPFTNMVGCLVNSIHVEGIGIGPVRGLAKSVNTIVGGRIYGNGTSGINVFDGSLLKIGHGGATGRGKLLIKHLDGESTGFSDAGILVGYTARVTIAEECEIDLTAEAGTIGILSTGGDLFLDGDVSIDASTRGLSVRAGKAMIQGNGSSILTAGAVTGSISAGYAPVTGNTGGAGALASVGGSLTEAGTASFIIRTQ